MPNLYPATFPPTWTVPTPVLQRRQTSPATAIKAVTYAYNPVGHDFVVTGRGDVPLTSASEAAVDWAAKAVSTQRGAHLIYSRSFGADIRRCLRAGSHAAVETALQTEMRRAVKRDIRINDLDSFQFKWGDTVLQVAYRVVLSNGQSKGTTIYVPIT